MCLGLSTGFIKPKEKTPAMTIQECYDRVKAQYDIYVSNHEAGADSELAEELRLSAEALQKQIARKPISYKTETNVKIGAGTWCKGTTVYRCPCCNSFISRAYNYCNKCGQAILFEEATDNVQAD